MDEYDLYIMETFAQQTLQNWQLVFRPIVSMGTAKIDGRWGWGASSNTMAEARRHPSGKTHTDVSEGKHNNVEADLNKMLWFRKLNVNQISLLQTFLAFKLLTASIMLASGSCLGKIRRCTNSDGGSSAKWARLHCASCWGCRVAPKCTPQDSRNIRTLYITLLTERTGIKWSLSKPVTAEGLQWPAEGVVLARQWMDLFRISVIWSPHAATYFPRLEDRSLAKPLLLLGTVSTAWGNNSSLPPKVSVLVGFVRCLVTQGLGAIKHQDQLKTRQSELENPSVSVFRAFY